MCIFSGDVGHVANTKIFACSFEHQHHLVYSMEIADHDDVAMVLPVPCYPSRGAFEFVNLENHPDFFNKLKGCFPHLKSLRSRGREFIPVVDVGCYEASFVCTPNDFENLDPRFRMPPILWDKIPAYRNYSFAVFQLRKGLTSTKQPMAFSYHPKNPDQLFYPTIHIHDGKLERYAEYDHELYFQPGENFTDPKSGWEQGSKPVDLAEKVYFISNEQPVYRKEIKRRYLNRDIILETSKTTNEGWLNFHDDKFLLEIREKM